MFSRFCEPMQLTAVLWAFLVALYSIIFLSSAVWVACHATYRCVCIGLGGYVSIMPSALIALLLAAALDTQFYVWTPWHLLLGVPQASVLGGFAVFRWQQEQIG